MLTVSLDWLGGLGFRNSAGSPAIELDSSKPGVASPTHALAYAVAGCMAMDLVYVLERGRHVVEGLTVRFEGERAADHPRRFVSMTVHFALTGAIDAAAVGRALELSKTKYCSVWHTIRPDVLLETSFTIEPGSASPA